MGQVLAAVDIGSNTAHLLVAEIEGKAIRKIADESEWLSLGEVVGRLRSIPIPIQENITRTLANFKRLASVSNATSIYAFATEAVRKAANGKEVMDRVEQATGIQVHIVNSHREAELGVRGTLVDMKASKCFLADVGGGSAQVAACSGARIREQVSLPLGTGTLIAQLGLTSPCDYAHLKRIQRTVHEHLENADLKREARPVVACGGVARGLWRALHPDGDLVLHMHELDYLIWATQRLTAEQIVERFRVKAKRAVTLLPGAVVFKQVLELASQDEMKISRFGVREGALLELAEGKIQGCPL
jgi:exopolyphosphatase/guanosine-5'-triphosphate,3'-diphosphate pyrophosphatase